MWKKKYGGAGDFLVGKEFWNFHTIMKRRGGRQGGATGRRKERKKGAPLSFSEGKSWSFGRRRGK